MGPETMNNREGFWGRDPIPAQAESGFSLIELMVVIAVLIAVVSIGVSTFTGVDEDARATLTRAELQEVAKAIRQFRQDTGYYPKEGPFDHEENGGQVDLNPTDPEPAADLLLFESPANLEQLYRQPTNDGNDPAADCSNCVLPWDAESGRGWRGPYLKRENLVDVGDALIEDGTGNPVDIDTAVHFSVWGVADPSELRPQVGGGGDCVENPGNTACVLDWRPYSGGPAFLTHGRPFLYFIADAAEGNVTNCTAPCIVALGPNGDYEQGDNDDIVVSVN